MIVIELAILDLFRANVLREVLNLIIYIPGILLKEAADVVQSCLHSHVIVHLVDTTSIERSQIGSGV